MNEIFIFLLAFQVKHLIADYYLQFPYMYENKGKEQGWFIPLCQHTIVHGISTYIIVLFFADSLLALTAMWFDIITHFIIDRWKATRKDDISTSSFWHNLGIDQMLHHIVGIIIIYWIIQLNGLHI